jgi:hypothetical protein
MYIFLVYPTSQTEIFSIVTFEVLTAVTTLASYLASSSILKMEALGFSETSDFLRTTRRYHPEDLTRNCLNLTPADDEFPIVHRIRSFIKGLI